MNVLGLGDKFHLIVAGQTPGGQHLFVFAQVVPVNNQQLVLVELNFLGGVRVENGNACATVIDQQVLVVPEDAFQHRHVDVLAVQVEVAAPMPIVARFQNHVD